MEWWDAALLPNKTYDDLAFGLEYLSIRTQDSPVTLYIQHPIPIPTPGDKSKIGLKPLKLTTKARHFIYLSYSPLLTSSTGAKEDEEATSAGRTTRQA